MTAVRTDTRLHATGLRKRYGAREAVASVDLEVFAGEIVGLLGPNGAGKSTTISMIAGVVRADAGTVVIDGHSLASESMLARASLGLVPQDLALYEDLTARQNLAYVGALYHLTGTLLDERVAWALDIAKLSDRADEQVKAYSGGMKRRLNLVAGILHKPALLILDEPTVGVDPQSRTHLLAAVRALARDGMAVLYTSHHIEEVQALADRIAIMDAGRIIASGTLDELLAEHGAAGISLELSSTQVATAVATALREHPEVTSVVADDDLPTLRVTCSAALSTIIVAVEDVVTAMPDATLVAMSTRSGDLEAVFLALTGGSLRDEAA